MALTMTSPEAELRWVWHRVAGSDHDELIDDILSRHREPHRRYHTATHVMWVCRHVDALVVHTPVGDPEAVLAAALFHDVVYDTQSSANEEASAVLADRQLTVLGWLPQRCAVVVQMIEATATHQSATDDASTAILLDADLAILGAEPAEYQHYVTAVRAEYAHVDDAAWRSGRAQVLHRFLAQASIYRTETMAAAREGRARANLAAELALLKHGEASERRSAST